MFLWIPKMGFPRTQILRISKWRWYWWRLLEFSYSAIYSGYFMPSSTQFGASNATCIRKKKMFFAIFKMKAIIYSSIMEGVFSSLLIHRSTYSCMESFKETKPEDFLAEKFVAEVNDGRSIYRHFTCARDRENIKVVFQVTIDLIKQKNMRYCGMI